MLITIFYKYIGGSLKASYIKNKLLNIKYANSIKDSKRKKINFKNKTYMICYNI